ncbi:crp-like transcriptional regulator [Streptococcus sobrinus DSM 20742 = ATCC 33478]|nr:crp-like transcriptional regulator [Streptococcus sobrinus DSM 20742 = ATCC 33478]
MTKKALEYYLNKYRLDTIFPQPYIKQLQLMTYDKGQAICQQGQVLEHLFYFIEGHIKIVRRLFNGKEHILETQNQPTLIGDIELMNDQTSVSSVIALDPSLIIQLPLTNREELYQDPLFLYQIGRQLAQKLEQQNIISSTNISYSVKERLATYILAQETQGVFQLQPSVLADIFGTSYRHLSRVAKQLQDQNIIEKIAFKTYKIVNRAQLEKTKIED